MFVLLLASQAAADHQLDNILYRGLREGFQKTVNVWPLSILASHPYVWPSKVKKGWELPFLIKTFGL